MGGMHRDIGGDFLVYVSSRPVNISVSLCIPLSISFGGGVLIMVSATKGGHTGADLRCQVGPIGPSLKNGQMSTRQV
ncbi:hypothetical protein XELAEV_18006344mg [Xenopus laevis]|uniref:Uncharacterized protein n=1 Tax=Xenopus laevis TaxID=8355 RepID=A0A974I408_XENLA|nr:hypothetical protein XELAEV_18006344mg [Xenopus laevis]